MLLSSPDGTDANDGADAIAAGALPPRRHAAPSTTGAAPARLPATSGFLTGKGVAVATDPAAVARMRAMLLSSPDGADANDGADAIAGALPPRRGSAARPGAPAATNLGRSVLKAFQTANGTIVGVAAAAGSKAAAGTAPALAAGSNTVFGAGASAETGAGAGAAAPAGACTATVNTSVTGGLQRRNPSLHPGKISGFKKPRTSVEVAMAAADRVDEPPGRSAASARGRPSALDAGRGGGKKPWRQKGTGRARAGSIRSPLWVGGGVVFGPKPRDYSKKVNARVRRLAFSRALFDRCTAGELAVIEAFQAGVAKTKAMNEVVARIAPKGRVLLVDAGFDVVTSRASRNLERVSLQDAAQLNTLDLAQYAKIIVSTKALEAILVRANGGKN